MKKLGLCVRHDCNNYGSMLQILATQKAIENAGWKYEIIRYDKMTLSFLIKNISRLFNPHFMKGKMRIYSKKLLLRKYPEIFAENRKRAQLFAEYRKQYIGPYSPIYKGYENLEKGSADYDAVMVGSDQLWLPSGLQSKFYNLVFVKSGVKKISFSTSFGVAEIPKRQKKLTKEYLNRIDFLSVREIAGANIVKALTGRDAIVALDPTLLFSGDDWQEIFPAEPCSDKPYIFAYFLGKNPLHREMVHKLAKEKNLKIITCPHLDEFVKIDLEFGDEQRYNVDPVDFLNLIRNAEYICTDSFHGTVFSILNHKKFVTFSRYSGGVNKSINSRIESLFELLGLQNRHYTNPSQNIAQIADEDIDYDFVEKELHDLRKESLDFLNKALNE